MTAPITPDERAAMREAARFTKATVGLYGQTTPTQVEVDYANTVLRLLDALEVAEARQNAALGRVKTAKDEVRRVDNFLRLEREAARENLARAEKVEAELAQLRKEGAAFINEVQAEALRDAARAAVSDGDDCIPWSHDHDRATVASWLDARADRTEKGET